MTPLTDIQYDALVEIFNIAIGRSAAAMSRIVNDEIVLSIPSLAFLSGKEALHNLSGISNRRVCGVMQEFTGPFRTKAMLMFPEEQSLEIVRLMVGESYSLDELSELEQEAMGEIGNILLNACIGSIANITGNEFNSTLPEVLLGTGAEILALDKQPEQETVLLVYIDFIVAQRTIQGYMAFLMNVPSQQGLIEGVDRFIAAGA